MLEVPPRKLDVFSMRLPVLVRTTACIFNFFPSPNLENNQHTHTPAISRRQNAENGFSTWPHDNERGLPLHGAFPPLGANWCEREGARLEASDVQFVVRWKFHTLRMESKLKPKEHFIIAHWLHIFLSLAIMLCSLLTLVFAANDLWIRSSSLSFFKLLTHRLPLISSASCYGGLISASP